MGGILAAHSRPGHGKRTRPGTIGITRHLLEVLDYPKLLDALGLGVIQVTLVSQPDFLRESLQAAILVADAGAKNMARPADAAVTV